MIHCLDCKKYPIDAKVIPYGSEFAVDTFLVRLIATDGTSLPTSGTDVEELPDGMKFAVGSKLFVTNNGTESKAYIFNGEQFTEYTKAGGGGSALPAAEEASF